MNGIRSILVHLDADERSQVRLRMAHALAAECKAQLTALYAVTPAAYAAPMAFAEGSAALLPELEKLDRQRRDQARALFDRVLPMAERHSPPTLWADAAGEPTVQAVVGRAWVQDLLVLGQQDAAAGSLDPDLVPSVLIDSGTPGIVIPAGGSFEVNGLAQNDIKIVLAWKPSREAARALHAALPWLHRAHVVHLAVEAADAAGTAWPGAAQVQAWLRLQGVKADIRPHEVGRGNAGQALLELAHDVAADLLVMGCFGHSRARELLMGGASRTVLRDMHLPVLMAH
jgi:nucleotide-binding universal stress UspA family protein